MEKVVFYESFLEGNKSDDMGFLLLQFAAAVEAVQEKGMGKLMGSERCCRIALL